MTSAKLVAPPLVANLLASPRQQWLCLAGLVALNSIVMTYRTQPIELAILTAMVWCGAFICIEDMLPDMPFSPSHFGLLAGSVLLAWGMWRSTQVFHGDAVVYGLAFVQAIGLAMLLLPIRKLMILRNPLLIMSITAFLLVPMSSMLPEEPLSLLTAKLSSMILTLTGQEVYLQGRVIWLDNAGVRVSGPCSGKEMIHQLLTVGTVFVLAFPLRQRWLRLLVVASTPAFAIAGNSLRISVLALINASQMSEKTYWFTYFHENEGSLVFSAISTSVFAWGYLKLIDTQIAKKAPRHV